MCAHLRINLFFFILFIITFINNLKFVKSEKKSEILMVLPVPFREHQNTFRSLAENLLDRGHHLTILTTNPKTFSFDKVRENLNLVDMSFVYKLEDFDKFYNNDLSGLSLIENIFHMMGNIAEKQLQTSEVQKLLKLRFNETMNEGNNFIYHDENLHTTPSSRGRSVFDAIIVDWSGPSLMNLFAYYFNAPLIGITPGGAFITSHEAIGNPNHPSIYPSILMPFTENLSIFQKILSLIFSIRFRYFYINYEIPRQNEIAKEIFGNHIPSLWEIEQNVDLLLVNSYQMLGNSRPIGPTTIYLGGIHRKSNSRKSLPIDLQNFISESGNIIYVNLGHYTKTFIDDEYHRKKFITVLETLGKDVIWNTNEISLDVNTTARIYHSPIMEQEDVLSNNKVKVFISCGGQKDIEDAIHHKIPVLGFTFSSNLEHYLLQLKNHEATIISNFHIDTNAKISGKLVEFFMDERYRKNMEFLNQLIMDQPESSLDRATWWIEYVIRNGGTKHLRSTWNKLSWFEYLLLDVFLSLAMFTCFLVLVIGIIVIRIRKYSNSLPVEKITRKSKIIKKYL